MKLHELLALTAALALAGCDFYHGMTNDEIIHEASECETAGMRAKALENHYGETWKVVCKVQGEDI